MKLVSFGKPREERAGVVRGDEIVDINRADASLPASILGILENDLLGRLAEVAERAPASARVALADVRLGPPVTRPSKIICLGLNYKDHAAEQNKEPPTWPLLFSKGPNVLCGHGDTVPYPAGVEEFDYEAEMAFVIGKRCKAVPQAEGFSCVAGYAVFMDLTARELQRNERQWFRGKSVDASGPFGPYLVTPDEAGDPHNLDIALDVGGETLQSSNTDQMTFGVDFLVRHISQTMTLEPGDVIATGTPPGVGVFRDPQRFLAPGDVVTARIENLGTLTVTVG